MPIAQRRAAGAPLTWQARAGQSGGEEDGSALTGLHGVGATLIRGQWSWPALPWLLLRLNSATGVSQRRSGPVDVAAVADVDDGDEMSLVVDPADDVVGSASCAEPVI